SVPLVTASMRSNALTTAPAGSTSILSWPPVISLTFLAKSWAYSWKISFAPQVLCQRQVIGSCALAMVGRATAAVDAAAAPLRNLRRGLGLDAVFCHIFS